MEEDREMIAHDIIGCAFEVRKNLGRFLLEKVYEEAVAIELRALGYHVQTQVPVQIEYRGTLLPAEAYKADLIVNNRVIVELKALKTMTGDHVRQLLTYMKLSGISLGFLMNFGTSDFIVGNLMREKDLSKGIYRFVNDY